MEFPDLEKHCNEKSCKVLDFLPLKCDSCDQTFCSTHFNYERHSCKGQRKDVQVPVCPLCEKPVPTAPGVAPDITVSRHIDEQCKSDQRQIFTNRCSHKGCKRKELIPVTCRECEQNYCLRHRHTADHECQGKTKTTEVQRSLAAKAAESRAKKPNSLFNFYSKPSAAVPMATTQHAQRASSVQVQNIQGNISEDEALARALALSIYELDESANQNRNNPTAAAQSSTTVRVGGESRNGQQSEKDKCLVS